jgi:hypothetical protein
METAMSAFADHALELLRNGFSPLPLRRNRLPLHPGWQALRTTPMTPDAIAGERWYGLGVMCGYGDLLGIDVDVDDRDIVAAVARSIPKSNCAKFGSKGFTVMYRATSEIRNRKFKATGNPKPIVEVLSLGNMTVVPPTWHPGAGREYQWCTPGSLFNLTAPELVGLDPEHIEALAKALEPWCPRKVYTPVKSVERGLASGDLSESYRRMARKCIRTAATRLSSYSDGRHNALFNAASGLGRYVHHGIISRGELVDALIAACDANGLKAKRGLKECHDCIDRGLDYSRGDSLPDLPAAKPRSKPYWQQAQDALMAQTMAEAEAGYYR